MKKYLFCRVLPHINLLKTSGNNISKLFLTLRKHENNEKLKLPSTIKTCTHPLLVTFDVLRLHVVTENKNQFRCAIFRILIYSNPKILQISFLKPFLAYVIKFVSSYKKFCRAVFKRRFCNSNFFFCIYLKQLPLSPKSIFTGEYQHNQYTCFFILAFDI